MPWTQTVDIEWAPELAFYEGQTSLLRAVDEMGELGAFRVQTNETEIRLTSTGCGIRVGVGGLTLQAIGPAADDSRAWEVADALARRLKPQTPRAVTVAFHFVEPLDGTLGKVAPFAFGRLFSGVPKTGAVEPFDWAMLMDIDLPSLAAVGQAEFGVVTEAEVPDRLRRFASRVMKAPVGDFAGDPLQYRVAMGTHAVPSLGLLLDARVSRTCAEDRDIDKLLASTVEFWHSCRTQMGDLADALRVRIGEDWVEES